MRTYSRDDVQTHYGSDIIIAGVGVLVLLDLLKPKGKGK